MLQRLAMISLTSVIFLGAGISRALPLHAWPPAGGFTSPPPSGPNIVQPGAHPFWAQASFSSRRTSGISSGPDSAEWVTDQGGAALIRIGMDGKSRSYPTPHFEAHYITSGADGRLWVTGSQPDQDVAAMTTSGLFAAFTSPSRDFPMGGSGLAVGPDRNVWFAEGAHIAAVTPAGTIFEYVYPSKQTGNRTAAVTLGPDGRIWFTELNGTLGAIDTLTHRITEYTVNPPDCGVIMGLAAGGDGNVYATCHLYVYRVSTAGRTLLRYLLPEETPTATSSTVETSDGNVWISLSRGFGRIVVYDPKPFIAFLKDPYSGFFSSIATGPDGNLWGMERHTVAIYLRNAILAKPKHLNLVPSEKATLTVFYRRHGSSLTATSAEPSVARVAPDGLPDEFAVFAAGTGSTVITIADGLGNSTSVPVVVHQ